MSLAARIDIETINLGVTALASVFQPTGPVLDIGSFYTPELKALCDRRPVFPGQTYVGCDIRPGPGVDRIENAEGLTFLSESMGTVLLLETLEHVAHPDRAIGEAHRVLTANGLLLISMPFDYRLHGFPTDYWRFTSSGLYEMLGAFEHRVVFAVGPALKPSTVFAIAAKRTHQDFGALSEQLASYMLDAMKRHRWRHAVRLADERGRDFLGLLLGRARIGVRFFDPKAKGGYANRT